MIEKCACQSCGQNIEFEAEHNGALVDCPNCARQTRLAVPGVSRTVPFSAPPAQKSRSPWPKVVFISIGALIIILLIAVLVQSYGAGQTADAAGEIMGIGFMTIIYVSVGILAFVLAVFWLIFPWMMYSKLNRVIQVLEQIRDQKSG